MLPDGYALRDFSSVPAVLVELPGLVRHLGAPEDLRARLEAALSLQVPAGTAQQQHGACVVDLDLVQAQYKLLRLNVEQRDVARTRSCVDGLLTMLGA